MATNGTDELFLDTLDKCDDSDSELDEESNPESDREESCHICNNTLESPRLLSCLHTYCQSCLEKMTSGEKKVDVIICPICNQETSLGRKGVLGLAFNYVTSNIQDMKAIISTNAVCTSCKTKEQAVARCSDCATFLCPNCNTAHMFMRCFENHKVEQLDALKEGKKTLHKPVYCDAHPLERIKAFCSTCMVPICKECGETEHPSPPHQYYRLEEAYKRLLAELKNLLSESEAKVTYCEEANNTLQNSLDELQTRHDQARGLINETFQSYRVVLEQRRDEMLEELKEKHSARELKIMEMFHIVEKSLEQIDNAKKFTNQLIEHGDCAEVLSLRPLVRAQLLNLINNTPKPEVNTELEFFSNMEVFTEAVKATFGSFQASSLPPPPTTPQQDSPPPVMPPLSLMTTNLVCPPSSVTSSPVSMPSSFEGDLIGTPMIPFTSIQEYNNLSALATMASEPSPTPSPTPTPNFTLNDLFNGDPATASHAMKNLEALAKLNNVCDSGMVNGVHGHINGIHGAMNGVAGAINGVPIIGRVTAISPINSTAMLRTTSPAAASVLPSHTSNVGMLPAPYPARGSGKMCTPMQVKFKFGTLGPSKGQFNSPHGFCLGTEEDIVVADTNNHRIQVFEKNGTIRFQFGTSGKEEGQLWYPRKVAVMKASGKYVVCDRGNERSRMQIFSKNGHFLKKIAIRYIDIVAGLAVTNEGNIVAVDSVSPTIFVITDSGDLRNWFDCSDHMREPSDLAINGKEFFVCDFKGHCVVVFDDQGNFLRRIGQEHVTNFPNGIDISDAGDVLVGDSHGNRFHVSLFNRHGDHMGEYECPYVKVSRCCGLKITSEGYIVTLAKNNHHVLVLNTLYVP